MRKRLFAVIMSALLLTSLVPSIAFASSQDEDEFYSFIECRKMTYIDTIPYYKNASSLDLSLVDKTNKKLKSIKYDEKLDLRGNELVALGVISDLFETYYGQYKAFSKKSLDALKDGEAVDVIATIDEGKAQIDSLPYVYDEYTTFDKYMADVDLLMNECKVDIVNVKNPKAIKAAKIVQKKPSADKKGRIKVKFGIKSIGDAKIAEYQVWRSTSKNFKKSVKKYTVQLNDLTKSTLTYTNAKNLKKGTRYYYKVCGMVTGIDGKVTYTQWSKSQSVKCKKTVK